MQDIRFFGLKQEFIKWINAGNSESYDLNVAVSCLEKVSEYAIRKKISQTSFWNISQYFTFELIYQKLLTSIQMQILERNTYKTFINVGKLYLKFLKEKPYLQQANEPNFSVMTIAGRDTKVDSDPATIILPTIQNVETSIKPFEMEEENPTIVPFETVMEASEFPPLEIEEENPTIDLFETAVEEKAIIPHETAVDESAIPPLEKEEDKPTINFLETAMDESASNPFETAMVEWEFPPSEMDFEEIEINPFEKEVEEPATIFSETKIEESSILPSTKQPEKHYLKNINPDEMIAWLITQRNENGTRYLKYVVERYIHTLQRAPAKLDLPPGINLNVFSCQSVEEFNMLWERYKAAPNFESINAKNYGRLSEGLSCLSRYLSYLTESQNEKILFDFIQKPAPSIEQPELDIAHSVDTVKAAFFTWISAENKAQIDPSILISSLDSASEQLQKWDIAFYPLWEITKPSAFDDLYKKARDNNLFRMIDQKTYSDFMIDGQVFLEFLNSKPVFQQINVNEDVPSSDEQSTESLTIKDAVIRVLSDKMYPMTADEIYKEIIKQGLYVFRTQNPVNVVRNIIESACDNSGYSEKKRVAVPCFHFERNDEGKRVYSSLATGKVETSKNQDFEIEKISTQPEKRYLKEINPDEMIAWLSNQPNAKGIKNLKSILERYVYSLKHAPAELILPPGMNLNVFSCQSVEEFNMLWERYKAAPNFESINRKNHHHLSTGLSFLSRYLAYLTENQSEKILFDSIQISAPSIVQPKLDIARSESGQVVDFEKQEQYQNTKPVSCKIQGKDIFIESQNWNSLLVAITEWLMKECNPFLTNLDRISLYGSQPFFLPEKPEKLNSRLLSNGKWISVNYSANMMVTMIGFLLRYCKVPYKDVVITYVPKNGMISEVREQPPVRNIPKIIDEAVITTMMDLLEKNFPNGIRPNSMIDLNKFKKYFFEETGEEIENNINDIPSILMTLGVKNGEKIFLISESGKEHLAELFDRLILEGNCLFFYNELYDAHADFFQSLHIFSSDLLKKILSELRPNLFFTKLCCQTNREITVKSEIVRCFEKEIKRSYDQLSELLPYVPAANIRHVLAQNRDFIWVSTGVYTHVQKISFDESENHENSSLIKDAIYKKGFGSLAALNIAATMELNPELSEFAIRNGFFEKYLSDRYEKRGNVVSPKGIALNSIAVFEDFCHSSSQLTLADLLNYDKEINCVVNISQSLQIACNNMVRINRDIFVADCEIHFDIDAVDNALDMFFHGDVIPLKGVTSFTSFPYMEGYPWNWYLLESYCRRFSQQFGFQSLAANNKNIGAIYRKSARFKDYAEIIATVVADKSIRLNQTEVGDYLSQHGFIARRTSFISEVITQASLIREGKC